MSSLHNAHSRTPHSPPHVRKSATKAARATPHSRSVSTPKIIIKGAKTSKHAKEEEEEVFDFDDDDMGSTFLQYWLAFFCTFESMTRLLTSCQRHVREANPSPQLLHTLLFGEVPSPKPLQASTH